VAILAAAAPASAQWSQVPDLPTAFIFTVWANGDTIAASADSTVYLSTDAGTTWRHTEKPVTGVNSIQALYVHEGLLYAGTFGQGVHVSNDLGATWSPFNQGLVGGLFNSQLDVVDLEVRSDTLYAATSGAGVYARKLDAPSSWRPLGNEFEANQDPNLNSLALGNGRLLAAAGANGDVFTNDPGETDWTISRLDNVGIHAGLAGQSTIYTGIGWVVGSNLGIFHSATGREPWTRFAPGIGTVNWTAFATAGGHLFGAFDTPSAAVLEESSDDGVTWQIVEVQPSVFVKEMAVSGSHVFAARADGLWKRPLVVTSVPIDDRPNPLHLAVAGPQPFQGGTRLRFDLPRAGAITIELFDVHGRLVGDRIERQLPSGRNVLDLNAQRLASGVYMARLTAGGRHQVVRLVHLR
jgi:hypothetical protein